MGRSHLNASVLSWLRCFEAAARCGSFTNAASELFLTQGAISQQVRELERRLGCSLFDRMPRQLKLTREGKALAAVVTRSLDDLEAVLKTLHLEQTRGDLTLSCYSSFALLWLMPRIGAFFRQHPLVDLRVSAEFHALEKATLLREGIDAAIRYDPGRYHDLEATPLLSEYLVPVASPDFVQAHSTLSDPAELDGSLLLHDATAWPGARQEEEWQCWLEAAGVRGLALNRGRRFNLSQLALSAALEGQGIAMGRTALAMEYLGQGRLVPLFPLAVKSPACYHLVSAAQPHGLVATLAQWLRLECAAFEQRRLDALPFLPR